MRLAPKALVRGPVGWRGRGSAFGAMEKHRRRSLLIQMKTPHIPCLRRQAYQSLNESEVKDYRDGSTKATMSQVNAGTIRRDLLQIGKAREALARFSTRDLVEISAKAGELFLP